jgi:hypothetical protein
MRLIKWILTSLTFLVTFAIVIVAEYATMAVITLPGGLPGSQGNVVERVHIFPDPTQTQIVYTDAITFWSIDIEQSLEMATDSPEYEIRAWFEWEWWQDGMQWADVAYSSVKAIVVPAVSPVYEIKEMYVYYGTTLEDFKIENPVTSDDFTKNLMIEKASMFGINSLRATDFEAFVYTYNIQRKIDKYNSVGSDGQLVYKPFVEKFINYTGDLDGDRGEDYEFESVDALSAFLFYQIFLAIILALYFTYQNPIIIKRNNSGENEVEGRFLPRVPKIGFGKRDKKSKEGSE